MLKRRFIINNSLTNLYKDLNLYYKVCDVISNSYYVFFFETGVGAVVSEGIFLRTSRYFPDFLKLLLGDKVAIYGDEASLHQFFIKNKESISDSLHAIVLLKSFVNVQIFLKKYITFTLDDFV